MGARFLAAGLVSALVGACVDSHPLVLASDHPANPDAAVGAPVQAAAVGTLAAYRPAGALAGPADDSDMDAMPGMDMKPAGKVDPAASAGGE